MASSGAGGGALWATCVAMFTGALVTGLPAVCWWEAPPQTATDQPASGLAAAIQSSFQGQAMRMLTAGLMLGSGLGVVVPEGFFAFVDGAPAAAATTGGTDEQCRVPTSHPKSHVFTESGALHLLTFQLDAHLSGLPEWCAGAALLGGFVGMLAMQLWLERGTAGEGHSHKHGKSHSRGSSPGNPRRWGSGYGSLPSTGMEAEAAAPASSAAAAAAPSGLLSGGGGGGGGGGGAAAGLTAMAAAARMEFSHRHGGTSQAASVMEAGLRGGGGGGGGGGRGAAAVAYAGAREDVDTSRRQPGGGQLLLSRPSPSFAASATVSTSYSVAAFPPAAPEAAALGSSAQLALAGLLVHSAADGLAVGAASLGGGGGALTLSVAAAIMAHKLPVTLGLTAYLREAGWRRARVFQGLLAFSASAPLAALATYYLLRLLLLPGAALDEQQLGLEAGGGGGGGQAVALAVLFSGGTFLAAATQHILPVALGAAGGGQRSGEGEGGRAGGEVAGGPLSLVLLAVGALLPLLIAALLPEVD